MSLRVHLLWLLGLVALGFWGQPNRVDWPDLAEQSLVWLPFILAFLTGFISLFLNRFQPIAVIVTLCAYYALLWAVLPQRVAGAQLLLPLLALCLPVHLMVWRLLPEKGFHHLGWIGLQAVLWWLPFALILWGMMALPAPGWGWVVRPVPTEWIYLPWSGLALSVTVLLLWLAWMAFSRHTQVLDLAMPVVLVMAVLAMNAFGQPTTLAWWVSLALLAVLLAVVFEAHHLAYTDTLTGLKGRRALFESFAGLGRRYAIAMMDIDHFKQFNDRYGHETGDHVLQVVARHLKQSGIGRVYRYGGEEFTLVFPGQSAAASQPALEALRERIASTPLLVVDPKTGEEKSVGLTASFGVAERDAGQASPEAVMQAADAFLYQAKKAGRNRVKGPGSTQKKAAARKRNPKTTRPGKK
jgi:diguanylate cyclase (GGDEF)-like protein